MFRAALLGSILVYVPFTAVAQVADPTQLETLTEKQKQAEAKAHELSERQEKIKKEIQTLQSELVKATAQSRGFEKAEAEARAKLETLLTEEKSLLAKIDADQLLSSDLLAALQRIERKPPPAMLVAAQNATDSARAASLIAYLTNSLNAKTEMMKTRVRELSNLRADMDKSRQEITANANEVSTRLRGIKSVISNKANLNTKLDQDRKQKIEEAEKLASEAKSLRDLIRRFEDRANDVAPRLKPNRGSIDPSPHIKPRRGMPPPVYIPPNGTRFADARGSLPLPVFGSLSKKFGARLSGGGRSKGVSLKTSKSAQVVAPFPGRVEFSGEFNDDNVVILNVGSGYFIVMTGLGDTFTKAGDDVDGGEPLGTMPSTSKSKPEFFMEFRKDRSSIDPTPWIGTALAQN